MKTVKLISGGQTGADISIVAVAKTLDLPIGGTVPAGWLTEAGANPALENLGFVQSASADYRIRTCQNVEQSDATLIFAVDPDSDGTRLTIDHARRNGKSFTVVNPFAPTASADVEQWLDATRPAVLNIAGNRESRAPGIQKQVERVLQAALGRYLRD